ARDGRGAVAVVGEGEPGRQGAGLGDGGNRREARGGHAEAARRADDEGRGGAAGEGRRLDHVHGQRLGGIRQIAVGRGQVQRVVTAGTGSRRARDGGRGIAVVVEGQPGWQAAGFGDRRGRVAGGGDGEGARDAGLEVRDVRAGDGRRLVHLEDGGGGAVVQGGQHVVRAEHG